ncbi:MAG: glycerophosphoryl diester phosphodiesterase [Candidatus Parcubacteria bacterium]|jgi:glycerophosphoryl diester phosphodiesterase|nr:glycerophosphoryl diester phosphodiesterase [Candidatus Parcubacteria bacterium]
MQKKIGGPFIEGAFTSGMQAAERLDTALRAKGTGTLVMAHRGGYVYGRENALETVQKALAARADIIELDVRKSRDGILYCHHGSVPWGIMAASFFGLLTFAQIERLVGKRATLNAMLASIPLDTLIYLDVKDFWITKSNLKRLTADRKNITIMPFGDFPWLKRLLDSGKVVLLTR